MRVCLEKAGFLKALHRQQGVVERRATVPILGHVLMEARDGRLALTGTDLELSLLEEIEATVEQAGRATVSAHLLYEVLKRCPEGQQVTLSLEKSASGERASLAAEGGKSSEVLLLTCGASVFRFPSLGPEKFPKITNPETTHTFVLTGGELRRLIDQTRFAMSQEDVRFYLNGVYLHATAEDLKVVATDAHRLALSWLPLPPAAQGVEGMILSRKTVAELRRLLDQEDTDVHIALSKAQGVFKVGKVTLYARFVGGAFPTYDQAIPKAPGETLEVGRQAFADAVDRVSVMASQEKTRTVKLSLQKDRLVFSARAMDGGSSVEEMPVTYQGEPFEIGFNARYVLDALQQIQGETFLFCFKDATTPVVLKDKADDHVLYVLMPMRG